MKRTIGKMLERAGTAGEARRVRGFTLIELLIGIGAIALISVGVAAIFDATGKTIRTGKRVSQFSEYAGLIERRLRDDIAAMTREGYLIIRNEYATRTDVAYPNIGQPGQINPDAVLLYDGDEHPRLRRTDELMFFAKGQFTSARELLDPRFIAGSDAAAIYYGHGEKARDPGYSATDPYYQPSVRGDNGLGPPDPDVRLGYHTTNSNVNPNEFASDWILVRHVTLLRPPREVQALASNAAQVFGTIPANDPLLLDSDVQISMQPAASNLFRSLCTLFPTNSPQALRQTFDTGYRRAQRFSGLVDIATTDLSEIRQIVTTADTWPGAVPGGASGNVAGNNFFTANQNAGTGVGANAGPDGSYYISGTGDQYVVLRMQTWMEDGLPGNSGSATEKQRIRCERAPINYTGVLAGNYTNAGELASRRADQMMLSASNFLPRCTEFIVEWSFGHQWPSDPTATNYNAANAGQLVWYGIPRTVNGDQVADFYMNNVFPWDQAESVSYPRVDGGVGTYVCGGSVNPQWLIHGQGFNATQTAGEPLTSFFGYSDPTFNPDRAAPVGVAMPDGKLTSPADSLAPTVPWPWPRFMRVTLSLADPSDPSVEQSFQFVFEVPCAKTTP